MFNKDIIITIVDACDFASYRINENDIYITFHDFAGFDDHWNEIDNENYNEDVCDYILTLFDNNCIKAVHDFYTYYKFVDCEVKIDYTSYDI